jgi:hypothetical protein
MTILIDGEQTVTFGPADDRQYVTFSFPAGLGWDHEDLEAAVEAALDGTLTPGQEPGARSRDVEPVQAEVTTGETADGTAQVCVDEEAVFEYSQGAGEQTPTDRAQQSAERLRSAFLSGLLPNAVTVKAHDEGFCVAAAAAELAVATEDDAQALDMDAEELAETWASALRKAIVAANKRAAQQQGESAEPDDEAAAQ